MAKKSRTHKIVMTVVFNRACTRQMAVYEARNNIHGEFYTDGLEDGAPDSFKVRGMRGLKKKDGE